MPSKSLTQIPDKKLTIIGGGIVGYLEAYFAFQESKSQGERIRISLYEKNASLSDTTTSHLVPNLTPYEILSVLGTDLAGDLQRPYTQGGVRVDDVPEVNDSQSAVDFIRAVQQFSLNKEEQNLRTETLLALGKQSMKLWQELYSNGDEELKNLLKTANYNPCQQTPETPQLHQGYRIDLTYGYADALSRAQRIIADYSKLGYAHCAVLTPEQTTQLDPFLTDFCLHHSEINPEGLRVWKQDAIAYWRPGGCIDTQVFLPLFQEYLRQAMGQYVNHEGKMKDCFRVHFNRTVDGVLYDPSPRNSIQGLSFFNSDKIKYNKNAYQESDYVFCPGEAVGTLKKLGFKEPEYARFAGASLKLKIEIPENQLQDYATFAHHMSVYKNGTSSAWQARCVGKHIIIGIAGTKAFYGDKKPDKDQEFAKNRNLVQLNIINDILPQCMSLALGRPTQGIELTAEDLKYLEEQHIAQRFADSRAVTFDAFPTLGAVYNEHGSVNNARCTTHLGSGGASFSPAAIQVSRMFRTASDPLTQEVLNYSDSQRCSPC